MKNPTNNKNPKTYKLQKVSISRRGNLSLFTGLKSGIVNYRVADGLSFFSDGTFVLMMRGIRGAYFMPNPYDESDGTFAAITGLLNDIADDGVGLYFSSKSGYRWIIFDIERYAQICQKWEFTPDEFRIYPQQSI